MADVNVDERALDIYLSAVATNLIGDLAQEVADLAHALAPVRTRRTAVPTWARRGYVGVPGRLKASVAMEMGRDNLGIYADVTALWYGRFMDPKASQLHYLRPFLPTALYTTVAGRVYRIGY